jgi:hypothetical protein
MVLQRGRQDLHSDISWEVVEIDARLVDIWRGFDGAPSDVHKSSQARLNWLILAEITHSQVIRLTLV